MDTVYTIMKNKSEFSITLLNSPSEVNKWKYSVYTFAEHSVLIQVSCKSTSSYLKQCGFPYISTVRSLLQPPANLIEYCVMYVLFILFDISSSNMCT